MNQVNKSAATPAVTPAVTPVDLYVGVNLEIQGRDIMLAPKTPINEIATQGIELELPNDLYLGKAGDILDGIAEEFGYQPKKIGEEKQSLSKIETGITAVDNLIKKVMAAELTISDLYIKVHPSPKDNEGKKLVPSKISGHIKPDLTGNYHTIGTDGNPTAAMVEVKRTKGDNYYINEEKNTLKIPPKQTDYTLGLAAKWSEETPSSETLGSSKFKLKGLYIMITNEKLEEIEKRRLDQKSRAASVPSSTTVSKELKPK
jgi:hypothetical protein